MYRVSGKEALLLSVTTEIRVHIAVFAAVAVPLVAVALPVVLVTFATYALGQSAGALWNGTRDPGVPVAYGWLSFFVAVLLLARFLAGCRDCADSDARAESELAGRLRQPKGAAGEVLLATVARLWRATPHRDQPVPELAWYSGFQVAAHARAGGGQGRICVSSALWDRVAKRDVTAELILAHEMGHIVHRDWRAFRRLSITLHGIRSIFRFGKLSALGSTAVVLVFMGIAESIHGVSMGSTIRLMAATLAISALCFLLLALSDLFVRRYASFILSMMELRADACAALWTVGLHGFARHLEADNTLHRSTAGDLAQSLFSPDITHISESERLALIRTPDRLFTPKLRYFAGSVLLALLLPLNPITPPMFNGAIDHLILVATVAALHASTMAMLVLGGFSRPLGWKRAVVLGMFVSGALGAASFNLYEFGYLLTNCAVAIANDSGFGRDPVSWSVLGRDAAIVANGLAKKAVDGVSGWWILATLPLTIGVMKLMRPAIRFLRPWHSRRALALTAAATTFAFALVAGRDPNRSALYDGIAMLLPDGVLGLWPYVQPWRLALPAVAGLVSVFVLGGVLKLPQVAACWRMRSPRRTCRSEGMVPGVAPSRATEVRTDKPVPSGPTGA